MLTEIAPVEEADFGVLAQLAREVWLAHYAKFVSREQLEYMLAARFSEANLRRYLDESDRWLELLRVDGEMVGYCSYSLTNKPKEMKLEQLYLRPALHGRGLGKLMMQYVEARAREMSCVTLMLTVNKRNEGSIAVYRKSGFTVREAAQFDIGNGFVMDDYVMEKRLD